MPYKDPKDRLEQSRRWRAKNRERSREIQRAYRARYPKRIAKQNKKKKLANPKRELAEGRFRFAIKRGWIKRPEGKQFHHPDYDRPYYGVWVTPMEHRQIHVGWIECPPCVDYESEVRQKAERAKKAGQRKGGRNACRVRWQDLH
jgi:hypothetical protein